MSRVFVVQKQHRWDDKTQTLVPKYDLTPAEEYGDLVFLLSPSAAPFHAERLVAEVYEGLRDFDPAYDLLLLIGNPVLIGLVVALAGHLAGPVPLRVLQWSGRENRYLPIVLPLGIAPKSR